MASRIAVAGVLLISWVAGCGMALGEDKQPGEARLEALTQKLDELEARLVKLDFILDELKKIRGEDLPKLERTMRGTRETSSRVAKDDAGGGPRRAEPPREPMAEPGREPAAGANGPRATPEEKLARIDQQLRRLDEVAEQLDALRNTDLPKLQRDVRGLRETSGHVDNGATPPQPAQGRVIIENITGITRDVTVNGITYRIVPGAAEIPVPYGEVTTQLSAWEAPQQWATTRWQRTNDGLEMRLQLK